jgi:hypothetical protein
MTCIALPVEFPACTVQFGLESTDGLVRHGSYLPVSSRTTLRSVQKMSASAGTAMMSKYTVISPKTRG